MKVGRAFHLSMSLENLVLRLNLSLLISWRHFWTKKLKMRTGPLAESILTLESEVNLNDRIPFTLKFHLHNHEVKSIILKNFKLLQNDSETGTIFSQPPLISFKRDKNIENFLIRSSFQTNDQSGTFKCTRSRCQTCLFIHNVEKVSVPKRSNKNTDHFGCISANVIYCITCTYFNKLYLGETRRRLGRKK